MLSNELISFCDLEQRGSTKCSMFSYFCCYYDAVTVFNLRVCVCVSKTLLCGLCNVLSISWTAVQEKPKPLPDQCFEQHASSAVYSNDDGVWYDVLLNKVDISHGAFGYNNYYRMQVLHETIQVSTYFVPSNLGHTRTSLVQYIRSKWQVVSSECTPM